LDIVRQFGTPSYAYDIRRLRTQAQKLQAIVSDAVDILYSLKANASLGISDVLADCGLGADVASAGELATAVEAGFPAERIFVAGPYKSPELLGYLWQLPAAIVSVDSLSELKWLAQENIRNRMVLRLRPDFGSCAQVAAGSESRFGIIQEEIPGCRELITSGQIKVVGFHVYAGSQVLDSVGITGHLRGTIDLVLRTADRLGITAEYINLGGGFGIPDAPHEQELELGPIGAELRSVGQRAAPARLVLELGRYLVAQAGWYLTSVVGFQTHQGRPAVLVDGGTHQRADCCGLGLRNRANPPVVLDVETTQRAHTDVLGCLSLPADVLAESSWLPPLVRGNVLAFANAGAYGLWSSPAIFHGYTLPAEVAFDGSDINLMRARQPARRILDGQFHVRDRQSSRGAGPDSANGTPQSELGHGKVEDVTLTRP
jgi:diaminopimelate decarboxylase